MLLIIEQTQGISAQDFVNKHGDMGFFSIWSMVHELRKLVKYGCLREHNEVFFSVIQARPVVEEEPDRRAAAREPVPFSPLKTFLPTISPRGQTIEKRHFKSCNSPIRYQKPHDI